MLIQKKSISKIYVLLFARFTTLSVFWRVFCNTATFTYSIPIAGNIQAQRVKIFFVMVYVWK